MSPKTIEFAQMGPTVVLSRAMKNVFADGKPALPICSASATVTFSTTYVPKPSGPSQRAMITPEPKTPASINRRVPNVSTTPETKLPKTGASSSKAVAALSEGAVITMARSTSCG